MTELVRLCTFSVPGALVAALRRSFFDRAGLEVSVERARGSTSQLEGLLDGQFDVIHTNADNVMKFRSVRGSDVTVVSVVELGLAMAAVVAPDIRSWDQLRGRRVAVDAADSGFAFVMYELLARNGLDADSYDIVEVGNNTDRATSLIAGEVSASLLGHHPLWMALDQGCHLLARGSDEFPGYPGLTVATSGTALATRHAPVVAYARALRQAAAWAADPDNGAELELLVAEENGTDVGAARELLELERAVRSGVAPGPEAVLDSLGVIADLRSRWTRTDVPAGYADADLVAAVDAPQV